MLISACMIVKNEQKMLEKTLSNLINLVDEVILVDTGSTDETKKIAAKYGSKVFDFPWINDFSAARNESLKHAQGEWIIWVDADEFIKKEDMDKIKFAIKDSKEIAYLLKVSECREGEFKIISYNLRPKLFRNKIGVHFERPINEQPFTKDGKALGLFSKELDIPIYHWGGFLADEKLKQKKLRNLEILKKVVESGKGDEAIHFLLGMNYKDLMMFEEAIREYDNVIKSSPDGRFAIPAREEIAWAHYQQKKIKESYLEAIEVLKLDPESATAMNIIGSVFMTMGEEEKAIDAFKSASEVPIKEDAVIVNLRQRDYISNLFLSRAYLKTGKKIEAFEAAQKAYNFDPTDESKEAMDQAKSA